MKGELKIREGINQGILDRHYIASEDTLERVNQILNMISTKCDVNILIQSNIKYDTGKPAQWQCLIGRKLERIDMAQIFSNGLGDTIGEAMANSINEFIEYYGWNKDLILSK